VSTACNEEAVGGRKMQAGCAMCCICARSNVDARHTCASQPHARHFNSDANPNTAEAATAVTRQLLLLESRQREGASEENGIAERLGLLLQVCDDVHAWLACFPARQTALLGLICPPFPFPDQLNGP